MAKVVGLRGGPGFQPSFRAGEVELPHAGLVPGAAAVLNREGWLTGLARLAEPAFRGFRLPPYRVTCGWPSRFATGRRVRRVGECHGAERSKGGVYELFISPLLDDPLEVAGTVCHELAHVAAGVRAGHGPDFKRVCLHAGLTKGRPTQAMPGRALEGKLRSLLVGLGAYPHQAIRLEERLVAKAAPAVTARCGCGCSVRITLEWVERAGLPTCGCGGAMEVGS